MKCFLALIAISLLVFSAFAEEASKPAANKETAQPETQGDAPEEAIQGYGGGGRPICRQYCCQQGYHGNCLRWCRSCTTTTPIDDAPLNRGGGGGPYCRQYCCQQGYRGNCLRWCRSCTTTTPIDAAEVGTTRFGGGGGGGPYCRQYCCQQGYRGNCLRWCRSCNNNEAVQGTESHEVEVQNNDSNNNKEQADQAQPQVHN